MAARLLLPAFVGECDMLMKPSQFLPLCKNSVIQAHHSLSHPTSEQAASRDDHIQQTDTTI